MNFSLEIGPHTDVDTLPPIKDVYITLLPGGDYVETAKKAGDSNQSFEALTPDVADDTTKVATTEYITTALADYTTTSTIDVDMATLVDMATHADLRSSEDVFGHAKIWVDGTTLNITTS